MKSMPVFLWRRGARKPWRRAWGWVLLVCLWIPASLQASLPADLGEIFEREAPKDSTWSVLIEDPEHHQSLLSIEPDHRLIPASNLKLAVCSSILLELGPEFVYETGLYCTGKPEGDAWRGNLYASGSGDPSIGGRFNGGDLTEIFRQWALELKQHHITTLHGDLVGIDLAFDENRHGLNWSPEILVEWYAAEVSALNFNDGCVDIILEGAKKVGLPATLLFNPPTQYLQVVNHVKTVSARQENGIAIRRDPDSTTIEVTGSIRARGQRTDYATVPDPTLYFLHVMKETLEAEGIRVQGSIHKATEREWRLARTEWQEIATHRSPPLAALIEVCLKNSQNLYAEQFLKTLGYQRYGQGSYENGILAVKDILYWHGCDIDNQYLADGSGLSRDNRISARALTQILETVSRSPHAKIFLDALPQAGVDGTLRSRMRDTGAFRSVIAKTGTLNGVRSLAGFIEANSGAHYVFAMIGNGPKQANRFSLLMDQLCALVAEKG